MSNKKEFIRSSMIDKLDKILDRLYAKCENPDIVELSIVHTDLTSDDNYEIEHEVRLSWQNDILDYAEYREFLTDLNVDIMDDTRVDMTECIDIADDFIKVERRSVV